MFTVRIDVNGSVSGVSVDSSGRTTLSRYTTNEDCFTGQASIHLGVRFVIAVILVGSAIIPAGPNACFTVGLADFLKSFCFVLVHAITLASKPERTLRGVMECDASWVAGQRRNLLHFGDRLRVLVNAGLISRRSLGIAAFHRVSSGCARGVVRIESNLGCTKSIGRVMPNANGTITDFELLDHRVLLISLHTALNVGVAAARLLRLKCRYGLRCNKESREHELSQTLTPKARMLSRPPTLSHHSARGR
jgi:hypothetical protein